MMTVVVRGGALLVALVVLAACAPRQVTQVTATANPETSYKLITPPDAPHYALQPGQTASLPAPQIGYFAPPAYPAALAKRGMPPVAVKAQLVFDTEGHVVRTIILANSYAGPGHDLFADAVRAAAAQWAFTPLVFEETTGGGTVPVTVRRMAKPFSLWFEFDFRMVDGKPVVSTTKQR